MAEKIKVGVVGTSAYADLMHLPAVFIDVLAAVRLDLLQIPNYVMSSEYDDRYLFPTHLIRLCLHWLLLQPELAKVESLGPKADIGDNLLLTLPPVSLVSVAGIVILFVSRRSGKPV